VQVASFAKSSSPQLDRNWYPNIDFRRDKKEWDAFIVDGIRKLFALHCEKLTAKAYPPDHSE
jgi:hypothetical protein